MLTPYKKAELKEILDQDIFYIDGGFSPEIENDIFSETLPVTNAAWYINYLENQSATNQPSYVLSVEEEKSYFVRYNYCKYMLSLKRDAYLEDASTENAEAAIVWNRKAAYNKEQITHANLALVLSAVKDFCNSNLDFEEMLSIGNFYLLKAMEKFDFSKNNKFSTYAYWAIIRGFGKDSKKKSKDKDFAPYSFDNNLYKLIDETSEENVALNKLISIIDNNTASLSKFELECINLRWRFDGPYSAQPTLEELSEVFGCTKQNVSRVEIMARDKIRKQLELEMQG